MLKKTVLRVATVFQRINGFLCNMVAEIHGKVAKLIQFWCAHALDKANTELLKFRTKIEAHCTKAVHSTKHISQ